MATSLYEEVKDIAFIGVVFGGGTTFVMCVGYLCASFGATAFSFTHAANPYLEVDPSRAAPIANALSALAVVDPSLESRIEERITRSYHSDHRILEIGATSSYFSLAYRDYVLPDAEDLLAASEALTTYLATHKNLDPILVQEYQMHAATFRGIGYAIYFAQHQSQLTQLSNTPAKDLLVTDYNEHCITRATPKQMAALHNAIDGMGRIASSITGEGLPIADVTFAVEQRLGGNSPIAIVEAVTPNASRQLFCP